MNLLIVDTKGHGIQGVRIAPTGLGTQSNDSGAQGQVSFQVPPYTAAGTPISLVITHSPGPPLIFVSPFDGRIVLHRSDDMTPTSIMLAERGAQADLNSSKFVAAIVKQVLEAQQKPSDLSSALQLVSDHFGFSVTEIQKAIQTLAQSHDAERGWALLYSKRYAEAAESFKSVLEEHQLQFVDALKGLANSQEGENDFHGAVETWKKGVALQPGDSLMTMRLAMALSETSQKLEAVTVMKNALVLSSDQSGETNPFALLILQRLAWIYLSEKDLANYDQTMNLLIERSRRAVLSEEDLKVYMVNSASWAKAEMSNDRTERAIEILNSSFLFCETTKKCKAEIRDIDNDELASIFMNTDKIDEAISLLLQRYQLHKQTHDGAFARIANNLGYLYLRKKMQVESLKYLNEATETLEKTAPDSSLLVYSYLNLSQDYLLDCRWDLSDNAFDRAIKVVNSQRPIDKGLLYSARNSQATELYKTGLELVRTHKIEQAANALKREVKIEESFPISAFIESNVSALALIYEHEEHCDLAIPLLKRGIQMRESLNLQDEQYQKLQGRLSSCAARIADSSR